MKDHRKTLCIVERSNNKKMSYNFRAIF